MTSHTAQNRVHAGVFEAVAQAGAGPGPAVRDHERMEPGTGNGAALDIRGLTKRYADGTLAIESLDLTVPTGSFFGLLGPNGAGKTTLISAICNLIRITEDRKSVV